jgi:hypothetical protein
MPFRSLVFQIAHPRHDPIVHQDIRLELHDFCIPSEFVLASPQISQPAWSWSNTRKIARVPSWSSAIKIPAICSIPTLTTDKLVGYFSERHHTYIAVRPISVVAFPTKHHLQAVIASEKRIFMLQTAAAPAMRELFLPTPGAFLAAQTSCLWP